MAPLPAWSGRVAWRPKLPSASPSSKELSSCGVAAATPTVVQAAKPRDVVTKDQFLEIFAHMELPKRRSPPQPDGVQQQPVQRRHLLTDPPPGLSAPPVEMPVPAAQSSSDSFQVLLRGLPDVFMFENVMTALIKAGDLLEGMISVAMRPGSKVLISFRTIEMVDECIRHFHDPQWAQAGFSISALYVQIVKRSPMLSPANEPPAPELESNQHKFSIDAPSFVPEPPEPDSNLKFSIDAPTFIPAKSLSADAPTFVPSPADKFEGGGRESRASTMASPTMGHEWDEYEASMAVPPISLDGTSESDESEYEASMVLPPWPPVMDWTSVPVC